MTRFFLAILALIASPAFGQAYDSGAAVTPNWSGTVAWTPPYAVDSAHPADTYLPAIVTESGIFTNSLWVDSANERTQIGTTSEAKFRTFCKPSFAKRADPLLFPGVYPAGHDHTFFGWMDRDNAENATYTTIRSNPASTCQGGPINPSLYWEPSVKKNVGGLLLTVMPDHATFYYTHDPDQQDVTTGLRRNMGFIGGADPANYNDTARRAEYAAASLVYPGSPDTPAGFGGISCYTAGLGGAAETVSSAHAMKSASGVVSTVYARYTKGPAGEDPWAGQCTAGEIVIVVNAPGCWDATNLRSPNGRNHFRYMTRKADGSLEKVCPLNYAKVMHFETKIQFTHNGWTDDLQHWYMASDRMRMATAECPDPTAPCDGTGLNNVVVSKDPCRATGVDFCNFSTAHFDLLISWLQTELERWQRNCGGLTIGGVNGTIADCGTGATDTNRTLLYGVAPPEASLSLNPVGTALPADRASGSVEGQRFFPVDPADENQGALEIHVGHDGG